MKPEFGSPAATAPTPAPTPAPALTLASTQVSLPPLIRPVRPDDQTRIADLLQRLSDRTVWLRYMLARRMTPEFARSEAIRMTTGHPGRTTLIAFLPGEPENAVGVAELILDPLDSTVAEVALVVRDDQQGSGIGTALLSRLIRMAPAHGCSALRFTLLAENHGCSRLLRRFPFPRKAEIYSGTLEILMHLRPAA